MNLDGYHEILQRFAKLKRRRWGYEAACPAHEDNRASLTIRLGDNGNLWVHCHKGCSFAAVAGAMGLRQSDFCNPENSNMASDRKVVATYDYRDEQGKLLYQVVRFEPKGFSQRRPAGEGWEWSLGDVRRVPYRLPELVASGKRMVICVEGEKDADKLAAEGLVATTNSGGAGKWPDELTPFFRGRAVCVIPDNDPPGHKHAQEILRKLAGEARVIKLLELPGLPDKGDVSDWFSSGHTAAELKELITAAPAVEQGAGSNGHASEVMGLLKSADSLGPDALLELICRAAGNLFKRTKGGN